jgi:hypothetical protein
MTVINAADLPRLRDKLVEATNHSATQALIHAAFVRGLRHPHQISQRVNYLTNPVGLADLVRWLRVADLYYVNSEMTAVCRQAANSKPGYRLHHDDIPSHVGLLVWADPVWEHTYQHTGHQVVTAPEEQTVMIEIDRSDGILTPGQVSVRIRAVLWAPTMTKAGPGVVVVVFGDTEALQQSEYYRLNLSDYGSDTMAREFGPLVLHDAAPLVYGDAPDVRISNHVYAGLLSTWLIMGQRIAQTTTQRADRGLRRAYAREGRPEPIIRYITLRRTYTPTEHTDDDPRRTYHHQWVVQGHWRNQWHPSLNRHKPVFVCEHIKGPEGAPMIGGERVAVLRR